MAGTVINEIGIWEYLTEFSEHRTPLSDFYIKTKDCRIIAAFDETNHGVGFLLTEQRAATEILFLASVQNEGDIKRQMLDYLVRLLPSGCGIQWSIIGHPDDEQLALDYGFRVESTLHLFRTVRYSEDLEHSFLQRLYRLSDSVEKRGYRTVCLSELTKEQKEQICKDPDGEFAPELHPELLIDDRVGGISERLSTAALKDGKVAAYSIIRSPAKSRCIFEILCVAKGKRKNGVVILPIVRSIREMLADGYDSMTFAVHEQNREMLPVIERNFSQAIESRKIQKNMMFYSGTNAGINK